MVSENVVRVYSIGCVSPFPPAAVEQYAVTHLCTCDTPTSFTLSSSKEQCHNHLALFFPHLCRSKMHIAH